MHKYELANNFIRVHKSYAAPVNKIHEILSRGFISIAGHRIPIGRKYRENVKKLLFNKEAG